MNSTVATEPRVCPVPFYGSKFLNCSGLLIGNPRKASYLAICATLCGRRDDDSRVASTMPVHFGNAKTFLLGFGPWSHLRSLSLGSPGASPEAIRLTDGDVDGTANETERACGADVFWFRNGNRFRNCLISGPQDQRSLGHGRSRTQSGMIQILFKAKREARSGWLCASLHSRAFVSTPDEIAQYSAG